MFIYCFRAKSDPAKVIQGIQNIPTLSYTLYIYKMQVFIPFTQKLFIRTYIVTYTCAKFNFIFIYMCVIAMKKK